MKTEEYLHIVCLLEYKYKIILYFHSNAKHRTQSTL